VVKVTSDADEPREMEESPPRADSFLKKRALVGTVRSKESKNPVRDFCYGDLKSLVCVLKCIFSSAWVGQIQEKD
jgi:hypothetical protein